MDVARGLESPHCPGVCRECGGAWRELTLLHATSELGHGKQAGRPSLSLPLPPRRFEGLVAENLARRRVVSSPCSSRETAVLACATVRSSPSDQGKGKKNRCRKIWHGGRPLDVRCSGSQDKLGTKPRERGKGWGVGYSSASTLRHAT